MPPHPYGWLSLLPPLAAIVLAIATRRVILSLVAGIFVGALVTTGGHPWPALLDTLELHFWQSLIQPGQLRVFSFTLLMGALIGVIHRSGGMRGLVDAVSPLARTRRSGQLSTWVLGLLIFFDDYANTLLLGSTLRPVCDRLRISREKLAYMVDSTAAPVAGMALVSTWVAVEVDYIRQGLDMLPNAGELQAFELFVASIPYRFYIIMALLFVPLTAIMGRDFGPMLRAERRRLAGDVSEDDIDAELETHERSAHWIHALLPIGVTLLVVVILLYETGRRILGVESAPLRDILGAAESSLALQYGALAGLLVAASMARLWRLLDGRQLVNAAMGGARVVAPAIAILWCAATLSRMTGNKSVEGEHPTTPYEFQENRLYTGDFLKELLTSQATSTTDDDAAAGSSAAFSVKLLPTIIFLLASIVAFSTGTSFGTMGILVPMVITLTDTLLSTPGQTVSPTDPLLLCTIGGVLAGAVFGDHCSPISDTTVLSSQASGCDHIAHVRTQLPYALTVAVVSVVLGTLPLGWGVSLWLLLPLQLLALVALLFLFGQPVELHEPNDE